MQTVTVGDMRAGNGSKTRLERAGPPAFTSLVEVVGPGEFRVRRNLAAAVDAELKRGHGGDSDDDDD
jgi:hypothetical protein